MARGGYLRTMGLAPSLRGRLISLAFAVVVMAFVGCGAGTAARSACAEAVLHDWTTGTLGSEYSPECYQAAIDALPEDLRAYTTAADDIRHAEISGSRVLAEAAVGPTSSDPPPADGAPADDELRSVPSEVIFLGGLLAALAAAGGAAAVVRRRRGR